MAWFDLPLDQLREHRTQTQEPPGLGQWWAKQVDQATSLASPVSLTRYRPELYAPLEVYDAEFSGHGGDRIKAWYLRPAGSGENVPTVVKFIGYGGGRGLANEHTLLPALGYAVLVMDSRGQGGRWSTGATSDRSADGPANSTVMTRGITSPEDYYYTRLFTDGARAVQTASELAGGAAVAVTGASQGGALALASAALVPDLVAVAQPDVPFMCDIQRAVTLTDAAPYREVAAFLENNVDLIPAALDTLRYVDCALLARRITARCLVSVGLMDTVCPPSTVFAAYNEITADKQIAVFPFTQHTVPSAHVERQLSHLREHFPPC